MPFGLTNAPAVFQALINDVLRDILNRHVFVYLDDVLIFSRKHEERVSHVNQVLNRLLGHKLYVKADKCVFHSATVSFLAYIGEKGQLKSNPEKKSSDQLADSLLLQTFEKILRACQFLQMLY